jgi:hypothetical protein
MDATHHQCTSRSNGQDLKTSPRHSEHKKNAAEVGQVRQRSLNPPTKTREWSPALAKAGAACRYWKARLYNATNGRCGNQGLVKLSNKYAIMAGRWYN